MVAAAEEEDGLLLLPPLSGTRRTSETGPCGYFSNMLA